MQCSHLIASSISAAVLALGVSAASAQSSAAASAGSGNTGSSVTGGAAAPRVQSGNETKKDDKLARGDRKFVEEAAGSGMFEAQAAQLAATKATDPGVKAFAAMLVDHHRAANAELTKIATAAGVELPAAPPRAMRNDIEKLGKKSGDEFDREFVQEIGIKAHEKDIKTFQKASKDLKDAQLKSWADKTLPTLKQHLAAAQKLPQAGGKGKSDAASSGSRSSPSSMGAAGTSPGSQGATPGTGGASGANKTGN